VAFDSRDSLPAVDSRDACVDPAWAEDTGGRVREKPRLVGWQVVFTKHPSQENPVRNPAPYEKLVGDLAGAYSRRVNIQHRLVYQVLRQPRIVKVIRMWTHYE